MNRWRLLVLVLTMVAAAAVLAASVVDAQDAPAAPASTPCAPGATYDPACDVDHDGDVDIFDIQLAASHWGQSGAWTSDNGHDHLGQTWIGSGSVDSLRLTGSYGDPNYAPLVLSNTASSGLRVTSTASHGVRVDSAGNDGVYVNAASNDGYAVFSAGDDGVIVTSAGSPSASTASSLKNGFEVAGAQGHGLYVGRADFHGVRVNSAGNAGLYVLETDGDGVYVGSAADDGLYVASAAVSGVDVTGTDWAGVFNGFIFVSAACFGCRQANFAINVGDQTLEPGDVVSTQGVVYTDFDTGPVLWQVLQAQSGTAVVGVVIGRAEVDIQDEHRPDETGKRLVPRAGAAQPDEYVTIVYSGPVQVKTAHGEAAITAGMRVTAATDGTVRPLLTRTVEGMTVAEGAPVLGVALEDAVDGLVWVLVNPQ